MKKDYYVEPKSSFLGIQKDASILMKRLLSNKNLLKLIYYSSPDWKEKPDLGAAEMKSLFSNKQISLVPTVELNDDKLTYVRISYNDFAPNLSNPYYRDHDLIIKIYCHYEDWDLGDYELLPYRIAGEIDSMLQGSHLSGIGEVELLSARQDAWGYDWGGITLIYSIIAGNEDKVNPLD